MGNLLAAVGNLTGAVHHYQMALAQDRLHGAAHSSLRLILCYQKFHRKAQSSVPKDIPPSPCPDGKTTFTSGADEPHVICTQVSFLAKSFHLEVTILERPFTAF